MNENYFMQLQGDLFKYLNDNNIFDERSRNNFMDTFLYNANSTASMLNQIVVKETKAIKKEVRLANYSDFEI